MSGIFDDVGGRLLKRKAPLSEEQILELVHVAYRGVLGREPDAEGAAHWSEFLRRGGSYDKLLQRFVLSPESRRRLDDSRERVREEMEAAARGLGTSSCSLKMAVLGNCQMGHLSRSIQALTGAAMPTRKWINFEMLADWESGKADLAPLFEQHDKVFLQPWIWTPALSSRYERFRDKVVLYPSIGFMAYHPDLVPLVVRKTGAAFEGGPTARCQSSLAYVGWKAGLSVDDTVALFRGETFRRLGFFEFWPSSVAALLEEGRAAGLPLEEMLQQWVKRGCFMHCHVHPKLFAVADIARTLLQRLGIATLPMDPMQFAHDYLANGVVWPVYPEIGEALGIPGSYMFKMAAPTYLPDWRVQVVGLRDLVERSFEAYAEYGSDGLSCQRLEQLPSYRELFAELQNRKARTVIAIQEPAAAKVAVPALSRARSSHPYQGLPAERFWRRAFEGVAAEQVDPVVQTKFQIDSRTRVATAGSCFAQRIAERLDQRGFNFLRTEDAPPQLSAAEAARRNYGAFSARFGFIYTARQLLQLFDRAYGELVPLDGAWKMDSGRCVDPFRPQIEPEGFDSVEALQAARVEHLSAVRRMFESLEVMVFTLGLTEAWRSRGDGAVFPLAPGVAAGTMDFSRYEFVNFSAAETAADLQAFFGKLLRINPRARLILTVSPVPLAATYAERHVLVSSAYSKAALRVAAEETAQRHPQCDYFPSYEIVTGAFNRGSYFAEDLRSVTPAGVDHIMRVFFGRYAGVAAAPARAATAAAASIDQLLLAEARKNLSMLCDEELLVAAVR
jgi:hypothetical protein